jgi:acetyltransferase
MKGGQDTKFQVPCKLRNGSSVVVRSIRPEDEPLMLELFRSFSQDTVRYRFFSNYS